jgi:glutamate synthase domain-containing protein 1
MYGEDNGNQIMRFKVAEAAELEGSYDIHAEIEGRLALIDSRLAELGVKVVKKESPTEYAHRYEIEFSGDMKKMADFIEDIEGVEILSIGHSLELVKDLGDAAVVSEQYGLNSFNGTHGIGHTRMATESDVDIRSAHPYWAYPFSDVAVVHNGQLTNYWTNRRALERKGHRFSSDCDSELIAVYIADRMNQGDDLETSMKNSVEYLDGVFTYLVATKDELGMAKDVMAAKPMVVYEGDDMIALASEEVAIRKLFDHQIETFDPYHGEVRVWQH